MAKKAVKRVRITRQQIESHRTKSKRDNSPNWDNCEEWSGDEFTKAFYKAMDYYSRELSGKDLKPAVIKWMESVKIDSKIIAKFKKTNDWRVSSTMGGIASCLLKGMIPIHEGFNNGKDSAQWLLKEINLILEQGKNDYSEEPKIITTLNIQDRVKEIASGMVQDIDIAIDDFHRRTITDFSNIDVVALLKNKGAKAAHTRIIREFYIPSLNELLELASGNPDEQLREGYNTRSRKQIKQLIAFYKEIVAACDMVKEEVKVEKKPRTKKPVLKEKLIEKLKYKKSDDALKLVSIDPISIIGAQELWVFDTRYRKLGKYIAQDSTGFGIKGSSITGFNEDNSIQKTIRKPTETLPAFKAAGKIPLRKFLDNINTTDIKLTGRINENVILLKCY